MGSIAADWSGDAGAAALAVAVVIAVIAVLRGERRRYGLLRGWQGSVVHAVPLLLVLIVGYAAWAAPPDIAGLCRTGPMDLDTLVRLRFDPWQAGVGASLFAAVGFVARHRFRRGPVGTVALGTALGLGVALFRLAGAVGVPCAAGYATLDTPLWGALGAAIGWTVARLAQPVLPRGWPAAVPDLLPPTPSRRLLALACDATVCWGGAVLLAALWEGSALPGGAGPPAFLAALAAAGAAVQAATPARLTPGGLAAALSVSRGPRSAPWWRVLLRALLLYGPPVGLVAGGLALWAPLPLVLHAAPAVVRRDGAGLWDLLTGCRVVPRTAYRPQAPLRMVTLLPRPPAGAPGAPAGTAP